MSLPPTLVVNPHAGDSARAFHRASSLVDDRADALADRRDTAVDGGPPVLLPSVDADAEATLERSIVTRRTRRDFDARQWLTLHQLARLLVFGAGRTATSEPGAWSPPAGHRAVPSAGASYAVGVHVFVRRVAGLSRGVYAYDVDRHALRRDAGGVDDRALVHATLDQPWMTGAAAMFALVGTLDRIAPRYASRGYRYMLFEAGHIAQNLYLLGAAHGLCVQATGGFIDAAVAGLLGLPAGRDPLYLLAVGP